MNEKKLRLPWKFIPGRDAEIVDVNNEMICSDESYYPTAPSQDQMEFIVLACNAHDDLVKALSDIMSATWRPEGISEELADAARAALVKAGAA